MKRKIICLVLLPLLFCTSCEIGDASSSNQGEKESGEGSHETLKKFSNAKLEDKEFTYDGLDHSLVVTGVPANTNIEYTNNNQKDVGRYEVTAKLSKTGYENKTLSAYLTIKEAKKEFTGVTLESKSFDYDGKYHSLEVSGAPENTNITWTNNSQINVGVYDVTAKLTKTGYNDLTLTAKLTINAIDFTNLIFESKSFEYDGKAHSLIVENAPSGSSISYSGNNKTAVGTYTVTATVSKTGYNTKKLTATLQIIPAKDPIEVDATKTALPLNNQTTFDAFKEAIFAGNYTLEYESGNRFFYYDGDHYTGEATRTEKGLSVTGIFAADNDKTYEKINSEWENPVVTETIYTKLVGDYAFSEHSSNDGTNTYFKKIPAKAFDETFLKQYPAELFDHVRRSTDNGFETFDYLNYHLYSARYDISNNKFTLDYFDHIDHTDIKRVTEEYTILTFYNIGNTKVNVPANHIGSISKASTYEIDEFIYDGISYSAGSTAAQANITLSYGEVQYLPKGHLELLPDVFGLPIKVIDMDFYTAKWDDHAADYTGYILDTKFDANMKYCLEYKDYGYLDPIDIYHWTPGFYLGKFISFGGEINYHAIEVMDIGFFQDRTNGSLTNLDKYNVSVINTDYYSKEQIQSIQNKHTEVFGYINIGLIYKTDPNYNQFKDAVLKEYEKDSNYCWVDVRNEDWDEYILNAIQGMLDKGVDGVYLDGTKVYEQYGDSTYYARQSIGSFMKKVINKDKKLMIQGCSNLLWNFNFDGNNNYPAYHVDYYVEEEMLTMVVDEATNTFGARDSESVNSLNSVITEANETFTFNVILVEHEIDQETNDKIISYCEEKGYHCAFF